jgi:hypothetical protein
MPIEPELYELFGQTIICENPKAITAYVAESTGSTATPVLDAYGRHILANQTTPSTSDAAWTAPVKYRCRLEYSTKVIVDAQGRERVTSGRAYLMGVFPEITTESRVTVDEVQPALQHPVLINVTTDNDQYGPQNTTLHFE